MTPETRLQLASALMRGFADSTGIAGGSPPQRYLWTDAFAVCNFLGLLRRTGKGEYLETAMRLVDQVHHVLGRHRADDPRRGWISGLGEEEGERHPTLGGLRIGKPLPERIAGDPPDSRLEWDQDGQYLHYLTQWMHALRRIGEETGNRVFVEWAIELAQAAHAAFTRPATASGSSRMVWKMSIDLRRVLVPSMGQHDPLDALLTYFELHSENPALDREIREARELCADGDWETDDALGIGALLTGIHRLAAMIRRHGLAEHALLARLVAAARISLEAFALGDPLSAPPASRLAFRELGLAIGLHAIGRMAGLPQPERDLRDGLRVLSAYVPIAERIDEFWSDRENRGVASWTGHRQINDVMLATSLLPDGYLGA